MMSQGHRVVLSGIGGSEFLGDGVPTPKSEFQNLLTRARLFTLIRQLNAWAIKMRKPRLPLLWEAVQGFFLRAGAANIPPWFKSGFVHRNRAALCGYPSRVKLFGPLPSFQSNMDTLQYIRRLQTLCGIPSELFQEVRYPYLDQSLLEFVFAIPREQVVGVGQRRFLMKRALVGIVPDAILNRKRKAFVPQELSENNSDEWDRLIEMGPHMLTSPVGIIDPDRFWEAVQKAQRNEEVPMHILKRTLTLEAWLRHLAVHGVLTNSMLKKRQEYSPDSERLPRASKGSEDPCLSACATRRESLLAPSEDKELQAPSTKV